MYCYGISTVEVKISKWMNFGCSTDCSEKSAEHFIWLVPLITTTGQKELNFNKRQGGTQSILQCRQCTLLEISDSSSWDVSVHLKLPPKFSMHSMHGCGKKLNAPTCFSPSTSQDRFCSSSLNWNFLSFELKYEETLREFISLSGLISLLSNDTHVTCINPTENCHPRLNWLF